MLRLFLFLTLILCTGGLTVLAQTVQQTTGWLMFLNSTKINKKWGTHLDLQLRSSDDFNHVRNVMFRPGLTHYINDKNEVTLGYLLNETYTFQDLAPDYHLTEHRIWEQYIFKHKIKAISGSHRFRVEQRFLEQQNAEDVFAQRFRYFFRFIVPLSRPEKAFERGTFVAIQNEVFLNLQNKSKLNNHVFDQNRAYLAAGYRFSGKLDIEAGYLNQAVKGTVRNTNNNVVQLAVYTRF
jgi:hypothetical protein